MSFKFIKRKNKKRKISPPPPVTETVIVLGGEKRRVRFDLEMLYNAENAFNRGKPKSEWAYVLNIP